jgi:hypothetical protein
MERRKGISDSRYESLPEELKEEFRQKKRLEEAADREYELKLKKKVIEGTIVGALVALAFGLIATFATIPFLIVLVACEAAAAYLIVKKQLDHTAAMLIYGIPPAPITLIFIFLGFLAVNVAYMLCSWVFFAVTGYLLAIWAREKERGALRYEPPKEKDSGVPDLGEPDIRDTDRD